MNEIFWQMAGMNGECIGRPSEEEEDGLLEGNRLAGEARESDGDCRKDAPAAPIDYYRSCAMARPAMRPGYDREMHMFRNERHDEILQILARDGRVSTIDLAKRYSVSEDSIRKDLQQLDAEGKLHRVYGGAVALSDPPSRSVVARIDEYREEKMLIAEKAFALIKDNMTIFLDVSSTNIFLADLIAKSSLHLVVVSNMLELLTRVAAGPHIEAQCPGGRVNAELNGLVGGVATYSLMQARFDLAFLGTLELDAENDCVSTFDAEDAMIKRTVLENSERTYVVGDSHKFTARGNYRYGRLSDFTGLITDDRNEEWREKAAKLGIEVL